MEKLKQDPVYDLLKILNDSGLLILKIDNEYFSITEFMPADRNTSYSKLKGKHITSVISNHIGIGLQGQGLVGAIQAIEGLPERELQYSSHYKWKWAIR